MRSRVSVVCVGLVLLHLSAGARVSRQAVGIAADVGPTNPGLAQAALTAPGSPPFHLKAVITERGDPTSKTEVEIFWKAPHKWRRTIQSETEFSQTLIVNQRRRFEENSGDYFPLWSQTLVAAMLNPKPFLDAYKPGDLLLTKANEASRESVGAARRHVDFLNYQYFHDVGVARILSYKIDPGDSYQARIIELSDLDPQTDPKLFYIGHPTPRRKQIRSVAVTERELRHRARQLLKIIWPQVLDGMVTGVTSYYVSTDRRGQVREVLPLSLTAERADDSARRQIMKWKFKPPQRHGARVQVEGVLKFSFDTRAYGPAEPLTDEEARKLASNIEEPVFPPGIASGATFTIRIAVDINGDVIESIAGDGAHEIYPACAAALRHWRFRPIMENGQPRPYRAQIVCRVP
jgi:hypothetical protein